MDYIIASSQKIFEGSADTQLFLITEGDQKFLISFSGFLNTTSDSLDQFRSSEIIIYAGSSVKRIIETTKKRSAENTVTEHHSFRRFPLTKELKEKIVDWMFQSEMLSNM